MQKEKLYVLGVAQTRFRKEYKQEKRNASISRKVGWILVLAALGVAAFFLCFRISTCFDTAMADTISQGDIIVTNCLSYLVKEPERGEIISFVYTDDAGNDKILQRRVIAFEGETVEIYGGSIYIDGVLVEETYVDYEASTLLSATVPTGCYYVLSDNRDEGPDSRDGLFVESSDIIGNVLFSF